MLRFLPLFFASLAVAVAAGCSDKEDAPKTPSTPSASPTTALADPVVLETWAKGFCQAVGVYGSGSTRLPTGANLPFEERKVIATSNARTTVESAQKGLAALAPLQPPPAARPFHEAYVAFVTAQLQALQRIIPRLEAARAESDFDAANIELDVNTKPYRANVSEKLNALPTDVAAAMNGIANCGRPAP